MRWRGLISVLAAAGCAGPSTTHDAGVDSYVAELRIDILRGGEDWVAFDIAEVDRPCQCDNRMPGVGDCVGFADSPQCSCDPPLAACLEKVYLEVDGVTVWDSPGVVNDVSLYSQIHGLDWDGAELVFVGCGGEARIPMELGDPPQPAILSAVDDGSDITVEWTSVPPVASALGVSVYGPLSFGICRVAWGQPFVVSRAVSPAHPEGNLTDYWLHALDDLEYATSIGVAHVLYGGSIGADLADAGP